MSALSATELSRLHRQRRLESSSPIHRVTPVNIKRRARMPSKNTPLDEASKSLVLVKPSPSYSFDEEVTAVNAGVAFDSSSNNNSTNANNNNKQSGASTPTSKNQHGRSFSLSSYSAPFTCDIQPESVTSPPPKTPSRPTIAAVTPPDSPGHRSASGAYSNRSVPSPGPAPRNPSPAPSSRNPSPASSLGPYLNTRSPPCGTPRPGVSRSNSTQSMPQMPRTPPSPNVSKCNSSSNSVVVSSTNASLPSVESDMPMDELMANTSSRGVSSSNSRLPPSRRSSSKTPLLAMDSSSSSPAADTTLTLSPAAPNGCSTALVPIKVQGNTNITTTSSVLNRLAQALQQQENRPSHTMTTEEQHLWDVMQSLLKNNNSKTAGSGGDSDGASATKKSGNYWEQKYKQRELEWTEQQKEHDLSLRAIQRVLADKEETAAKLQQELQLSQQQRDDTILKLTQKLKEMQHEMNRQKDSSPSSKESSSNEITNAEVADLKRQLEESRESITRMQQEMDMHTNKTQGTMADLKQENERKAKQIEELQQQLQSTAASNANNDEDLEMLHKDLEEKTASLENAKKIITSLENANGSLARELRAKLKEKEEELANLTSTSADRKRTLDSLATELRELQRQKHKPRLSQKQMANQRVLCQLLEKNVKALRQAAVQHESQNDQSAVDQISHIVSETFTSLKHNLESWEAYLKNTEVSEQQNDTFGDEQNMEAALTKKNEEAKALQQELERVKTESSQEIAQLQQEVESLNEKLATNMEILAKKGQELSVLRDSLNLEDNGVGYISDDGTEGEETDSDNVSTGYSFSPSHTNSFSGTLLVHGGPGVGSVNPNAAEMSDATAAEIQMLKNEIIKQQKEREAKAAELKAEKESLANAKMIISSLEKANKSMLEDLRSRLQDSNTAIASLLEKSLEHEKTISMLRKELETAKKEREKDEQKAVAQMAKLRDENLVFSMRLAAKDCEVEELQDALAQYEGQGQEVPISKLRMSSVEEKKDDLSSDDDED